MKRLLIAAALMCSPTLAPAQSLVGKTVVEGREVELFSDHSWRYAIDLPPECTTLGPKVAFCGSKDDWTPSQRPNPQVLAAYRRSSAQYGQLIVEDLGRDQGLTEEVVRSAIISTARADTGSEPTVISNDPVTHDGLSGETLVYRAVSAGFDTVFSITYLLGKGTLLQVITYEIGIGGPEYTETHKANHAAFLAATKVQD